MLFHIENRDLMTAWTNRLRLPMRKTNGPAYAAHCFVAQALRRQGLEGAIILRKGLTAYLACGKLNGQKVEALIAAGTPIARAIKAFDQDNLLEAASLLEVPLEMEIDNAATTA